MVERLKAAIEKARAGRAGMQPAGDLATGPSRADLAETAPVRVAGGETGAQEEANPLSVLNAITLDPRKLARERIVTRNKTDPAHVAFDALRTRLLKALSDNGWFRVAITSPNKGCGKTMVATNLAFSLARQPETRSILIDLDMRLPQLAARLGQSGTYRIEPYLTGEAPSRKYLKRVGDNLAVGLNTVRVGNPAELIQSKRAAQILAETWDRFRPDVVLFDTPPMLSSDDVLSLLPNIDGVLLVVGGGQTKAGDIEECERLMSGHTNFLGVVLNKAEENAAHSYRYYGT